MVLNQAEEQVCGIPGLNLLTALVAGERERDKGERAGDQRDIKREHLDKWNKVRFRGPSNKSKINLSTFSSVLIHAIVPFLSVIMRRSISNHISDWFILFGALKLLVSSRTEQIKN